MKLFRFNQRTKFGAFAHTLPNGRVLITKFNIAQAIEAMASALTGQDGTITARGFKLVTDSNNEFINVIANSTYLSVDEEGLIRTTDGSSQLVVAKIDPETNDVLVEVDDETLTMLRKAGQVNDIGHMAAYGVLMCGIDG